MSHLYGKRPSNIPAMTIKEAAAEKEKRVTACLEFLQTHPAYPIKKAAEEFSIARSLLRRRLDGVTPRQSRRAHNAKLSEAEEAALLRDMARLDDPSHLVPKRWITEAANAIIRARGEAPGQRPMVLVRPRWVDCFAARHNFMAYDGKVVRPSVVEAVKMLEAFEEEEEEEDYEEN